MAKNLKNLFPKVKFHPEITQRYDFSKLVGKALILHDAKILEGFNGQYGKHDAALFLFQYKGLDKNRNEIDVKFTTISSNKAILNQAEKIIANKFFPCDVTITVQQGASGDYLVFEVPDSGDDDTLPDAPVVDEAFENLPF